LRSPTSHSLPYPTLFRSSRLSTPPATSVLLALHSGIVEVGADGTAEIAFDLPDFTGTARLMAMAWTDSAVGHAQADVFVRDPVRSEEHTSELQSRESLVC